MEAMEETGPASLQMEPMVKMAAKAAVAGVLAAAAITLPIKRDPELADEVAMDMWRFTQEVFLDENSLFK